MQTTTDNGADLKPEIAHVLLIDVVSYSKLLVNEQIEVLQQLNQVVRNATRFRDAEASGQLTRLPTGDGMALLFFDSPEAPVQCALEISSAAQEFPHLLLRMGVHSGPIKEVSDVNDRANFAGAGINVAQRVLDCADAGHILVSKRVAEDLSSYRQWHPYLRDIGECEVKHGLRIHLFNLCKDNVGNPTLPQKVQQQHAQQDADAGAAARLQRRPAARRRTVAVGALLVAALALAAWWFLRPGPTGYSLAVLPFADVSEGPTNTIFANGVQDDILTYLSRISGLKVINRTSAMQYAANLQRNLRDIAKDLRVTHVLQGSVQRMGPSVRVRAQLVEAATDTTIWADSYDEKLNDSLAIQTQIARQITAQLRIRLSPKERAAIQRQSTENVVAHDLYVEAKDLIDAAVFSATAREDLLRAVELLTKAGEFDPKFMLAFYQLAHAHDQLYLRFDPTPARLTAAEAAIRKVEQLQPASGEAHLARAKHLYWGQGDYEMARAELALAEGALPNDPTIPLVRGYLDRRQGRWEESTRNLQLALELDPNNRYILQQIALTYFNQRRFPEMAQVLDRVVRLSPGDIVARAQRAAVDVDWRADTARLHAVVEAALAEDPESARKIVDHRIDLALLKRDPSAAARALADARDGGCQTEALPFPASWCEGWAARLRNDKEAAQQAFAQARDETAHLIEQAPDNAGAVCVLALADAMLGRKDDAIREGRRAVDLLPTAKDALNGPLLVGFLAIIYAWTGEQDLALEQLEIATGVPSFWSYGNLRLHPYWDPMRSDPRFEQIVTRLAPKD